ncbi:hypothetical protein B0H34DRAFT_670909 [Crassisporium funariophilum]|nr:hypothetical protein B0H34DRAFT_670909 [Crassisporium funariophilum]
MTTLSQLQHGKMEEFVAASVLNSINRIAVANQNTFLTARAEVPENYATWDVAMDSPPKNKGVNLYHLEANDEEEQRMSKMICYLSCLNLEEEGDNLPWLRISTSFMKVLLWLLKEAGVKHVPSFDGLQKVQKSLNREIVPTVHWKSPKGHAFSFNDPRAIVANELTNGPWISKRTGPISLLQSTFVAFQSFHETELFMKSGMVKNGNEPACFKDGHMIIPVQWLEDKNGEVYCDAWEIKDNQQSLSKIEDKIVVMVALSVLKYNMLDLEDKSLMPEWCLETNASGHVSHMPNPDRALAEGDPIYSCFIDVFGDAALGNRSKSWNKHWNVNATHRNLPQKLLYHAIFILYPHHPQILLARASKNCLRNLS